jgi:hypothetical protein
VVDRSGVAAILVGIAVALPRAALSDTLVVCPFRRLTGLPCPACGLTRSWQAAAHVRPRDSFDQHPLGVVTLLAAAGIALTDADEMPRLVDRRAVQLSAATVWTAAWLWRLRRR